MTTIDALKNLYVELGGNLEDVENINVIPKMIDALSEIAGSTIELPGVTAEDNGDVLTVVDGKWAKAESESEYVVYKGIVSGNTNQIFTLDDSKKKSDILADINAGKLVELFDRFNNNYYYLERDNGSELIFTSIQFTGTSLSVKQILFSGNDSSTTGTFTTANFTPAQ